MTSSPPPRVAIVAPSSPSGEIGGAERLFTGLNDALTGLGLATELVTLPCNESSFTQILGSYLSFYDLDLSRFDGVISTKAPTYAVRHRNHVGYLVHTMRVFYDMFETEFRESSINLLEQRQFIQSLDSRLLSPFRLKSLFSVGAEVANRLQRYNGRQAKCLRHPTTLTGFREGNFDYFFLAGRLHRWKRVDLAIDAVLASEAPLRLVISGDGEDADSFRQRARGDRRIEFVGRVSEERLLDLYANAAAVLFVPKSEDLGLVTLEAFLGGKPVITCSDSGEPARIVRHGVSGFVVDPEARSISASMEKIAADPSLAREMGAAGLASIADVTWPHVATTLTRALGFGRFLGK
jgi:glycosyltransferase involved in cell wall biosynthesis